MTTLPLLERALTAAVEQRPADLVIDLAGVGFCCVRGYALLATAAATARENGAACVLSGLPPRLDHFATLLWPEQPGIRYRSVAAAVTAIRADQIRRPT